MKWYYYLHRNGDLIGKNPVVVDPEYFDSPFVKKTWLIDTSYRETLYPLLIEALALGANEKRIKELADKWYVTEYDTFEFISRTKPTPCLMEHLPGFVQSIIGLSVDDFWNHFRSWAETINAA